MVLSVLSGSGVLVRGTECTFRVWSTCSWYCVYFQGLEYLLVSLCVCSGSGVLVHGTVFFQGLEYLFMALCVLSGSGVLVHGTVCTFRA